MVFDAIGRVPIIKLDMETIQILLAPGGNLRDEFLRRNAGFFGRDHDRCAMRIIGPDEMHFATRHALMPDPDIGLDVFHDVTEVERRVGVRQGSGNEQLAGHD